MGETEAKAAKKVQAIVKAIASIGFGLFMWWWVVSGADTYMSTIQDKVMADRVEQYNMTKRHGSPMELCVEARRVAGAYLEAKQEAFYATWKDVERRDCKAAALPDRWQR
jgi:hypothetical protein